jgi:glutamine cyclotransferase
VAVALVREGSFPKDGALGEGMVPLDEEFWRLTLVEGDGFAFTLLNRLLFGWFGEGEELAKGLWSMK